MWAERTKKDKIRKKEIFLENFILDFNNQTCFLFHEERERNVTYCVFARAARSLLSHSTQAHVQHAHFFLIRLCVRYQHFNRKISECSYDVPITSSDARSLSYRRVDGTRLLNKVKSTMRLHRFIDFMDNVALATQCRVDMPHLEWPLFWLGPVALGHALHWYLTPPFRLGWIMLPANLGTALRDLSRKLPSDPVICFHHRTTHGTGDCSCFQTKSLASNTDAEGLRKGKKKGAWVKKTERNS